MAMYSASLNLGVSIGVIISGLITINLNWRYIYYIATALIGFLTLVVFFTMPETSYNRSSFVVPAQMQGEAEAEEEERKEPFESVNEHRSPNKSHSYISQLKPYHGRLTAEPLWKLFTRPIVMLILPPVIWATLVMSVTIGFLVAISSNFASAFSDVYGFVAWQSGLCFVAGLVGSAFGIFFGGQFSDWVAEYFTKRNGGIREPEFRLPAISIGMVTAPLALILYGAGIQHQWHWIVPTIGLGLLNFSIAQATNVSLVYVIDSYRPITGETVVTQLSFKSAFGFLLSFYTNPWIAEIGYQNAFGTMAAVSAFVLAFWVLFFAYGKRIRHASLRWPVVEQAVRWHLDREVGE